MNQTTARDAVITGLGLVSAAGEGWRSHAEAVSTDTPPPEPTALSQFDASGFPAQVGFQVSGKLRPKTYMKRRKDLKLMSRDARLAVLGAGLALEDGGLPPDAQERWPTSPDEVGLYMGVGLEPGDITEVEMALGYSRDGRGGIDMQKLGERGLDLIPPLSALKTLPNMALAHVSINFDLMGPGESLSPWSTAGFHALAAAEEAIRRGDCQIALVGAADSDVDLNGMSTLVRLGLLADLTEEDLRGEGWDGLCDGWIAGEGAAFIVVESREHAEARGADVLARVRTVASVSHGVEEIGAFDLGGLADALRSVLPAGDRSIQVSGVAGHHRGWREKEAITLRGITSGGGGMIDLTYPCRAYGTCGAAAGLLNISSLLARRRTEEAWDGELIGLAWGPSGSFAAVRLDEIIGTKAAPATSAPGGGG